jgi:hypothetical protein
MTRHDPTDRDIGKEHRCCSVQRSHGATATRLWSLRRAQLLSLSRVVGVGRPARPGHPLDPPARHPSCRSHALCREGGQRQIDRVYRLPAFDPHIYAGRGRRPGLIPFDPGSRPLSLQPLAAWQHRMRSSLLTAASAAPVMSPLGPTSQRPRWEGCGQLASSTSVSFGAVPGEFTGVGLFRVTGECRRRPGVRLGGKDLGGGACWCGDQQAPLPKDQRGVRPSWCPSRVPDRACQVHVECQ